MSKSSVVALTIACVSLFAFDCLAGGGPKVPNGARPDCLADPDVRQALTSLSLDRVTAGGTAPDGTYLLPKMPDVPPDCRHILKDVVECSLGYGQFVMDQDNWEVYEGLVGLAEDWENRDLTDHERAWISGCLIQRLNYFGISIPILLEGASSTIQIDEDLRLEYPFAESTVWGDVFKGGAGELAWICTEEDVWSICGRDLGEPWIDTRVCDGVQECGIKFVGRCENACELTVDGYWDCSAQYGFTETVRVRMQTNTHPPIIGMCE